MRPFRAPITRAAALLAAASLCAHAAELPLLSVFSDVSQSGLELHIVNVPQTPVVALRVYVLGGVYGENERRGSGMAFCMQELLMDTWRDLQEHDGATGVLAHTAARLDYDALCLSALTTREYYPALLRQVADVLARPRISEQAWQRVRDRVNRQLLLDAYDQPYQLLNLYRRAAYLWHPVRVPLRGEHSLFAELTREDVAAYHHEYFVAGNIVVVLAGDLNNTDAASHVAEAFAALPHKSVVLPPGYEEPVQANQRWLERRADVTQSYVCIGYLTVPEGHRDNAALDIAVRMLEREREAMLAALGHARHPVGELCITRTAAARSRGALLITYRQDARAAAAGARALAAWLHARAGQPWRAADVRAEAETLCAAYRVALNDPAALAEAVGHAYLHAGNPYFPRTHAEHWAAVTADDVARVCRAYLRPNHLTTVLIQPHLRLLDPLSTGDALMRSERDIVSAVNYPLRRLVLENGMTVLLRRNPQESVVRIMFGALGGAWCEDAETPGVFALLGEMMCHAPGGRSPASFERACRAIGLTPQFVVGAQHVALHGMTAPEHAETAAALLCEAWGAPQFTREVQEHAAGRLRLLLDQQPTNMPGLADIVVRNALFAQQPYGMNWHGTPTSLARLTWRDAQQVWQQFCVPSASTLLISGDFDDARMEAAVRAATRRWRPPLKSEFFLGRLKRFNFHSDAPAMTVTLPPEAPRTAAVTRVYASLNPLTLIVCGLSAPGLISTSYPPFIVELARGGLAHNLDQLRTAWRDPDQMPIVQQHQAVAWSGYDTGWLYVWITVPPQYTADAVRRLQTLLHATLREMGAGTLLPAARARATFDHQLAAHTPAVMLDHVMRNHLFGYDRRLPLSAPRYFNACTPENMLSLYEEYARHPVTIIITPE